VSQYEESTFSNHFSIVILGLMAFTIIFAISGCNSQQDADRGENTLEDEQENARIAARIAPVGAVTTEVDGSSGDASAETTVVVQTVIEKPPFDAEAIYKTACFACHDTGAAEAPKLEAAAWVDRLAKGEVALAASAINGIGMMPPKGGRMDLSDEDVTAIVGYMISKVQE